MTVLNLYGFSNILWLCQLETWRKIPEAAVETNPWGPRPIVDSMNLELQGFTRTQAPLLRPVDLLHGLCRIAKVRFVRA